MSNQTEFMKWLIGLAIIIIGGMFAAVTAMFLIRTAEFIFMVLALVIVVTIGWVMSSGNITMSFLLMSQMNAENKRTSRPSVGSIGQPRPSITGQTMGQPALGMGQPTEANVPSILQVNQYTEIDD